MLMNCTVVSAESVSQSASNRSALCLDLRTGLEFVAFLQPGTVAVGIARAPVFHPGLKSPGSSLCDVCCPCPSGTLLLGHRPWQDVSVHHLHHSGAAPLQPGVFSEQLWSDALRLTNSLQNLSSNRSPRLWLDMLLLCREFLRCCGTYQLEPSIP